MELIYGTDRRIIHDYFKNCTDYHFCNNSFTIRHFRQHFDQASQGNVHCRENRIDSTHNFHYHLTFDIRNIRNQRAGFYTATLYFCMVYLLATHSYFSFINI